MVTSYYVQDETGRCLLTGRSLTHLSALTGKGLVVKATRTCSHPDGCPRPAKGLGLCQAHYMRWWSKGSIGPAEIGTQGRPFDGGRHPNYLGDQVGYSGLHIRLRKERGSAGNYKCVHCGGDAKHWAYDHTDPAEQTDEAYGVYSTDMSRYIPLCVSCHRVFDDAPVCKLGGKRPLRTHCKRGHEMTAENTVYRKDGGRGCKSCHRESYRRRAAQIKETLWLLST